MLFSTFYVVIYCDCSHPRMLHYESWPSIRLFVRLSVSYGFPARLQKGTEKPELLWMFTKAATLGVPFFLFQMVEGLGLPHNILAPHGTDMFEVIVQITDRFFCWMSEWFANNSIRASDNFISHCVDWNVVSGLQSPAAGTNLSGSFRQVLLTTVTLSVILGCFFQIYWSVN